MPQDVVLSVDLGTTNCAMAYIDPKTNRPECILNEEEDYITPSVVLFLEGETLVGKVAAANAWENPSGLVTCIKRFMGDKNYTLDFFGKQYRPEDVSALILAKLKRDAEARLGTTIEDAIITVPAYFDDLQRKATMEAARLAGLHVETYGIINEPTAAALSYGLANLGARGNVLVYDLGGGTFDITVLKIDREELTVLSSTGNARLGGKDWDERIVERVADQFKATHGIELRNDVQAAIELNDRAESAKKALSVREKVTIPISYQGRNLEVALSREEFEDLTASLLADTESLVLRVLEDAKLDWSGVSETILSGGSTRMPMVKRMLAGLSGKEPVSTLNPDRCVALGAALKSVTENAITVWDVTAHSLGMISLEGESLVNTILIPKDSRIPCSQSRVFENPYDGMTELDVKVLQGENRDPNICTLLKHHFFRGIKPMPKGKERVEVTFSYTLNGTVEVSAKDLATGKVLEHEEKEIGDLMVEAPSRRREPESVRVALLVDCSGSMAGSKMEDAKREAARFVDRMIEDRAGFELCVVTIGGPTEVDTKLVHKLSRDAKSIKKKIKDLSSGGSTPMHQAINIAVEELSRSSGHRYVLIVSDGIPDDAEAARRAASRLREAGIDITTIGIDVGDHNRFLGELSTVGHYDGIESGKLGEVFENIFRVINR